MTANKYPALVWFLILQLLTPTLALELETKHYYIIGGVAGGVVLLLILLCCCCCCCCKKSKSDYKEPKRSHQIRHQQEVRLQVDEDESRRNDSERTALPSAPPPVVRTESELREDARAEHRRRLDAILATQASAANRDHAGSGYDYSSHVNYMSHSERPRAPRESNVLSRPRQHREAQTTPGIPVIPSTAHGEAQTTPAGGSQTDLHDRDAISSDEYRIPYGYDHPDNIVTGFRRIQMAKKEGKMDPKSTALNRLGGTYTPPEDF